MEQGVDMEEGQPNRENIKHHNSMINHKKHIKAGKHINGISSNSSNHTSHQQAAFRYLPEGNYEGLG
jgi:hypothetical protein